MSKNLFVLVSLSMLMACGSLSNELQETVTVRASAGAKPSPVMSLKPTVASSVQPSASSLPTVTPSARSSVMATSPPVAVQSTNPIASPSLTPSASTTPLASVSANPLFNILKQGKFRDHARSVAGDVVVIKVNTLFYVRFKDFHCEPDSNLYVYAIKNDIGSPQNNSDFVSLGRLKSTSGDQNYVIPVGADPAEFKSIAIWSLTSSLNFGFAPLVEPLIPG